MKTIKVGGFNFNIVDEYKKYTRDELISLYWHSHPRFNFIKNCKKDSVFFDIGANDGELSFWKGWETPKRDDIKLHGADLIMGKYSKVYESFNVLNLDTDSFPYDDEFFDTAFSTHVVEHLKNPLFMINNLYRKLKVGGVVYIETPSRLTLKTPTRQNFIDAGFNSSTMNFYDDKTHVTPYDATELEDLLTKGGKFLVIQSGAIVNDYLSDLLISYGYENGDGEVTTYGLWLKFNWSNYVIAKKI